MKSTILYDVLKSDVNRTELHMPVNESVLALEDEDLAGEGHGEEVHDEDEDAGRHEVGEVGRLRVQSFMIRNDSRSMFNLAILLEGSQKFEPEVA